MSKFVVGETPLTCDSLYEAARNPSQFVLSKDRVQTVRNARRYVESVLKSNAPVYGINTGVGSQKDYRIPYDEISSYNRKLIRAHATRVTGPIADQRVVRAMIIIQLHELSSGYSGASPELIDLMLELASSDVLPNIDASGSVGASDLVPLSQLSNWILSHPKAIEQGLPKPKDALAMINCNALSLATGAMCIIELDALMYGYDLSAAFAMEGFRCNLDAISTPVNSVHQRLGQAASAQRIRSALDGSRLWNDSEPRFIQDPLSFRNVSQVHGAAQEFGQWLRKIWDEELQGCVINPLVNIGCKNAYSHGNMDTTRLTLAVDGIRQAIAKMADIACERIHKQQWPAFSGLPIGLAQKDSPSSGVQFLNLGHIAASQLTSVKIWANPHLLHSSGQIADGIEDTASNAVHTVHELARQLEACWKIITIEIIISSWAIKTRNIPAEALGAKVKSLYEYVLPNLPIGREGEDVFDIGPAVQIVRDFVENEVGFTRDIR